MATKDIAAQRADLTARLKRLGEKSERIAAKTEATQAQLDGLGKDAPAPAKRRGRKASS